MGIKRRCAPFVWLLLAGVGAPAGAEDPPEKPTASQIPQTQLTLRLNPLQGRATVVAIAEQTLTIVTAAHFLSPVDVGRTILIQGQVPLAGRLEAVTRNPGFQPLRSRIPMRQPPPGPSASIRRSPSSKSTSAAKAIAARLPRSAPPNGRGTPC